MIADTVFSIVVETIFLVQGKASISYWLTKHFNQFAGVFFGADQDLRSSFEPCPPVPSPLALLLWVQVVLTGLSIEVHLVGQSSRLLPSSCCPGDWASPAPWLHRDELAIFPWLWTSACSHHKSPGESGAGIVVVLFVMIQYIPSSGHCWLCLFCHISTLHCLWQPGHCLKELFIFSFLFFQLFGVFQAVIETSPGIRPINVFSPTIVISNAVFSRTITTQPKWSRQPFRSTDTRLN